MPYRLVSVERGASVPFPAFLPEALNLLHVIPDAAVRVRGISSAG